MVPGTRQTCLLVKEVFSTSRFIPLFSRMMRTLHMSTVVITATLAAVPLLNFCFTCLVSSHGCCSFCFPFVLPNVGEFFLFSLLFISSGEGGRGAVNVHCCRWSSLVLLYCVFSLLSTCTLTTSTAAAVWLL